MTDWFIRPNLATNISHSPRFMSREDMKQFLRLISQVSQAAPLFPSDKQFERCE
jgi:hypothetical protein